MKYLTENQVWRGLEIPIPRSLEFASNSGIRIEQLEKQNETSTYIIVGCLLLLTGVVIYAMVDANRREVQRWKF
jgi:hypothetical protein